jgi:hypothetical protein
MADLLSRKRGEVLRNEAKEDNDEPALVLAALKHAPKLWREEAALATPALVRSMEAVVAESGLRFGAGAEPVAEAAAAAAAAAAATSRVRPADHGRDNGEVPRDVSWGAKGFTLATQGRLKRSVLTGRGCWSWPRESRSMLLPFDCAASRGSLSMACPVQKLVLRGVT